MRVIEAALSRAAVELVDDADAHGELGLRVVVDLDLADVGLRVVPVEPLDLKLLGLVEVDGLLVKEHLRGESIDLADDASLAVVIFGSDGARGRSGRIDDDHVVVRRRAQRHRLGGEGLIGPVVLAAGLVEHALLVEV